MNTFHLTVRSTPQTLSIFEMMGDESHPVEQHFAMALPGSHSGPRGINNHRLTSKDPQVTHRRTVIVDMIQYPVNLVNVPT